MINEPLVTIIIAIAFFSALSVSEVSKNAYKIEMAKQGLEECPNKETFGKTIWVKDCIEYTKHNKKEK